MASRTSKLRIVANLYPEDLHLVLPKGKTINDLSDLEGKRVGIAQAGSGTQVAVLRCSKPGASTVTTSTKPS